MPTDFNDGIRERLHILFLLAVLEKVSRRLSQVGRAGSLAKLGIKATIACGDCLRDAPRSNGSQTP